MCVISKVPYILVHDEGNYGLNNREEGERMKELMEQAVPLEVPVVCDLDIGEHW